MIGGTLRRPGVLMRISRWAGLTVLVLVAACKGSSTEEGCSKDSDCKGDRVCLARQCAAPSAPPPLSSTTASASTHARPTQSKVRKAKAEMDRLAEWRISFSTTPNPTLPAPDRQKVLGWINAKTNDFKEVSEATPDADFAVMLSENVDFEAQWLGPPHSLPTAVDSWDCFQNCLACSNRCDDVKGVSQADCSAACTESAGRCCKDLGLMSVARACSCQ